MRAITVFGVFLLLLETLPASGQSFFCSELLKEQKSAALSSISKESSGIKMYFVLLRAFGGRDDVFVALRNQLPHFKKMGINVLWLSPPQPQTAANPPMFAFNDHGYWPSEHGTIDRNLGSKESFKRLVIEAKQMGIEIAIDAVLNHFGYATHVKINDQVLSTSDPTRFVVIPKVETTYGRHNEINSKIERSESGEEIMNLREELAELPLFDLPTLRKDVPENVEYLIESYKKFVDMGVTTFRLDAAKHMPKDFLTYFSNVLNRYSLYKWGKPARFIWEVYITTSGALAKFVSESVKGMDDPSATFFYDFPLRAEVEQFANQSYRFDWLKGFIEYREKTNQPVKKYIPLVEDHDNGKVVGNQYTSRLVYLVSDFFSENSTFLYHGSEQTGLRKEDRPIIREINPNGDLAQLTHLLGNVLSKYRLEQKSRYIFHQADQDTLVVERRIQGSRSLFLVANKGNYSQNLTLSIGASQTNSRLKVETVLNVGDVQMETDFQGKQSLLRLSPKSIFIFEVD